MKNMLDTMLVIAVNAHSGQFDRAGQPYILHPLKVMHYTNSDDQEIMCIAIGHDLLEDTDVTEQDLRDAGISRRVIAGILALTKIPGETHEEYKEKVKKNPDAVIVKMADLRHNSDIRRIKGLTESDIKRTIRYHTFYTELKNV